MQLKKAEKVMVKEKRMKEDLVFKERRKREDEERKAEMNLGENKGQPFKELDYPAGDLVLIMAGS